MGSNSGWADLSDSCVRDTFGAAFYAEHDIVMDPHLNGHQCLLDNMLHEPLDEFERIIFIHTGLLPGKEG